MGSRITALIIEPEQTAAKHLEVLLDESCQVEVVAVANYGEAGIQLCQEFRPESVFLDINLPEKDGVSLASQLTILPQPPRLVFTTADQNRAIDAFRLDAVDYLLKPLDPVQVVEAVNRLQAVLRPFEAESSGLRLIQKLPAPQTANRMLEQRLLSYCRLRMLIATRFDCCPVGKSSRWYERAGARGSIPSGKNLLQTIPWLTSWTGSAEGHLFKSEDTRS